MGKQKESANFYTRALALAQKLGLRNESEECAAALKIYKTYTEGKEVRSKGNLQESIQKFEAAVDLARKIESPEHELKCLRQLSNTYLEKESFDKHLMLSQRCLEIARQLNHRQEQGRALNNIGVFYWKSSNYAKALAYYEDALTIAREVDSQGNDESACLNNIGVAYMDIGDYDKALRFITEALDIDTKLKDDNSTSSDLMNIGAIFRIKAESLRDNYDCLLALGYYQKCINLAKKARDKKIETKALNNIGLVFCTIGKQNLALEYYLLAYNSAKLTYESQEISNICNNIGNAYLDLGDFIEARAFYNEAIVWATNIRNEEVLWETYFGLGRCSEAEGQLKTALSYYKMAVEVVESIRSRLFLDDQKAGFVRNKLKVYEGLIQLLFRLKSQENKSLYDEEIFFYIERAKARGFVESLRTAENLSKTPANPIYEREKIEISKRITAIFSELSKTSLPESRKKALLDSLDKEESEFSSLLNRMRSELSSNLEAYSFEKISVKELQGRLDHGSAVLEFFLGDKESYALFFTKDEFVLKTLPARAGIEESLKAYLKMLSSPPVSEFRGIPASQRLYRELIYPFEQNFPASLDYLIIVPDGILYYLPFETLVRDPGVGNRGQTYLIESFQISYAPSVSSLMFLIGKKKVEKNVKCLLALGDPSYSYRSSFGNNKHGNLQREMYANKGFDFSPIPYSRKEVQEISRNFPRDKVDVYLKEAASEETIKKKSLEDYRVIHFACHGFLDEKVPFRSALVLALDEDETEDGFLQVREILDLKLEADLVVLSACQTGRGKLENGEGILGLPRIFFYIGARSTISTLWKIDDHSTSDLMRYFYRFLIEGNNKAKALRLAKIKMMKSKFSHPFFWAGFVLSGDYDSKITAE